MVAMSGAIMPAPLAMPLIVTLALPMLVLAVATLAKVSVVMIALAASSHGSARAVMSAVNRQALRPLLPVKALALPELTTSARGFAPFSRALHHSTGADGH